MSTIKEIEMRLIKRFLPVQLLVADDSHLHVGHAGSKAGGGHYTVTIQAAEFKTLPRVQIHRLIYASLNDLIPNAIHALQIKILK